MTVFARFSPTIF